MCSHYGYMCTFAALSDMSEWAIYAAASTYAQKWVIKLNPGLQEVGGC